MKECPACHGEIPDKALTCPHCGGSWQPDGSFKSQWDLDMARLAAERERKVDRAEQFGRLPRVRRRCRGADCAGRSAGGNGVKKGDPREPGA